MNKLYVYQYDNGIQFVSTGDPVCIKVSIQGSNGPEYPRVLGCWHVKEWKHKPHQKVLRITPSERHEFINKNIELFKDIAGMHWKTRHRCISGEKIVTLARAKFGFSLKTSPQDIVNGFLNYYRYLD